MNNVAIVAVLACTLASAACTTLQPTEASPDEVQRMLSGEQLEQTGDRVSLVTHGKTVHEFRVTEVDLEQKLVIGKDARVPIADVIAVDTREVSVGRSALLAGGVGYGIVARPATAEKAALLTNLHSCLVTEYL